MIPSQAASAVHWTNCLFLPTPIKKNPSAIEKPSAFDDRPIDSRANSCGLMKPNMIDAAGAAQKQLHGFPRCDPEQRCGIHCFLQEQHESCPGHSYEQSLAKHAKHDEKQQQTDDSRPTMLAPIFNASQTVCTSHTAVR